MEMHELLTTAQILRKLQELKGPKYIMMMGPPGSGKSTLSREICRFNDVNRYSTDDKLDVLHKKGVLAAMRVRAEIPFGDMIKEIKYKIWQDACMGKSVLIDQTSMTKESRMRKLEWTSPFHTIICIDCTSGLTVDQLEGRIKERVVQGGRYMPRRVIADMVRAYEPPQLDEGFHIVIRLEQ